MKISVITATYNAMAHLPALAESLRGQTDKDFEWVVADGASTDGTVEYLQSITDLNLKVISQEDFGIYDALNRGIKACTGEFYLVMGADDILFNNAISDYSGFISSDLDMITASVDYVVRKSKPKNKMGWYYGQYKYVSAHAVGLLIRKELHERFGYYSKRFPIAADQYFILKAIKGGAGVYFNGKLAGRHGITGVSGIDRLGVITEFYRVNVEVGFNPKVQTLLYILRLLKFNFMGR